MRLYTSKVIADWLGLTERRVRQLRDEGIIEEQAPGLYDLRATTRRYISYLRSGSLADERAGLTRAKREAAEMENALRRGELHRTEEIESGIKTMLLNIRGRFLSLPAKLSPALAAMGGDQASISCSRKSNPNCKKEERTYVSTWHLRQRAGNQHDRSAERNSRFAGRDRDCPGAPAGGPGCGHQ